MLPALVVAGLCSGLVALSLWAQGTQLQLPITFYRARQTQVGAWMPVLVPAVHICPTPRLTSWFMPGLHALVARRNPRFMGTDEAKHAA